jgi:hypothetical protein
MPLGAFKKLTDKGFGFIEEAGQAEVFLQPLPAPMIRSDRAAIASLIGRISDAPPQIRIVHIQNGVIHVSKSEHSATVD